MNVLGLDPSMGASGLIVLDRHGDIIHQSVVKSSSLGVTVPARMKRIHMAVREIEGIVSAFQPGVVCLETYSFNSQSGMTSQIAEFGGMIRYMLWTKGMQIHEVAPTTLKKWASGKGSGDKTLTIASITSRYNVMFDSNDLYDAYGLARIAMQVAKLEEPANLQQREAIEVVMKPKLKNLKPEKKK